MTNPKLGDPIIYKPRVPYGRQSELFGFVTRVIEDGRVDLVVFPANDQSQNISNVARQSDVIHIHCWHAIEAVDLTGLFDQINLLHDRISQLEDLASAPEVKRGPGRPKAAA